MEVPLAGLVFLVTYGLIATDRVDKTIAALLAGTTVVVLGIPVRVGRGLRVARDRLRLRLRPVPAVRAVR